MNSDYIGRTALHLAAEYSTAEVVNLFIQAGADIGSKHRQQHSMTPLSLAASCLNYSAMEVLLQHGAEVNARDDEGQTPVHKVCASRSVGDRGIALKLLLRWNARELEEYNDRRMPAHILGQ